MIPLQATLGKNLQTPNGHRPDSRYHARECPTPLQGQAHLLPTGEAGASRWESGTFQESRLDCTPPAHPGTQPSHPHSQGPCFSPLPLRPARCGRSRLPVHKDRHSCTTSTLLRSAAHAEHSMQPPTSSPMWAQREDTATTPPPVPPVTPTVCSGSPSHQRHRCLPAICDYTRGARGHPND